MGTVDKPTFERIMLEHGPFVRRTLSQLGVCTRDLADVEQEVFRGVSRRLDAFDPTLAAVPETALRSWLFGICERQAASHRRASVRRGEVLVATEDLDTTLAHGPNNEEKLDEAERKAILAQLLETLEPRRRAVVVAYELEEIEMADVAASLSIPVNTAWNRLRLAREDLRAAWRRIAAQRKKTHPGVMPSLALVLGKTASAGGDPASWLEPLGGLRRAYRRAAYLLMKLKLAATIPNAALLGAGGLVGAGVHAVVASPAPAPVTASSTALASAPGTAPATQNARVEPPATGSLTGPNILVDDLASTLPANTALVSPNAPNAPNAPIAPAAAPSPAHSSAPRSTASARAPLSSGDKDLKRELDQLNTATNALDSGDVALSERYLNAHLNASPDGRLAPQRELLAIRVLLYYGRRNEARERARKLLTAHPDAAIRTAVGPLIGESK